MGFQIQKLLALVLVGGMAFIKIVIVALFWTSQLLRTALVMQLESICFPLRLISGIYRIIKQKLLRNFYKAEANSKVESQNMKSHSDVERNQNSQPKVTKAVKGVSNNINEYVNDDFLLLKNPTNADLVQYSAVVERSLRLIDELVDIPKSCREPETAESQIPDVFSSNTKLVFEQYLEEIDNLINKGTNLEKVKCVQHKEISQANNLCAENN